MQYACLPVREGIFTLPALSLHCLSQQYHGVLGSQYSFSLHKERKSLGVIAILALINWGIFVNPVIKDKGPMDIGIYS